LACDRPECAEHERKLSVISTMMRERSVDTMNATPDELQCVGEVGSSLAWS